MKMYRYSWLYRLVVVMLVLLLGFTIKSHAETVSGALTSGVQIPGTGKVDDSNIQYIGRWDWVDIPWVTRGYWPGVYLRTNFTGTANIGVQLGGAVSFYAQIDNGDYVLFSNANGVVNIASNLALDTTHVLKIAARTENDVLRFQKLVMDTGGVTVASPTRNIVEFAGDSITAGHNSSLEALSSYPKFTVDNLGADYVNISFTGICLVDGVKCGWYTGLSRAFFQLQTLPYTPVDQWDFTKYQPKAVVINIGTNDQNYGVSDTDFLNTYITFLENIRAKYPNAAIFAMRTFIGAKVEQTQAAVNARIAAGDTNVYYIDTSGWLTSSDYYDFYHLNDTGNAKVGQYLAAILRPYVSGSQPTSTYTFTPTALLPTNTATPTATLIVPTNTPVPTDTATATFTAVPPSNTPDPTATNTATSTNTATATFTAVPPSNTPDPTVTNTATATFTLVPPTNTPDPTATNTATATASITPIPPTDTPTSTVTPTPTANGTLRLEYRTLRSTDPTTQIEPSFRIMNYTSNIIPLSQLKIRYWFTRDTVRPLVFQCTYAQLGCANITGTFVVLTTPKTNADAYVEVGFTTAAGNLAANGTTNGFDTLLRKDNWSNFTQANDYSFDGTKSVYTEWNRVTLYWNGMLMWGTEPADSTSSTSTPTAALPTNTPIAATPTTILPTNTPASTATSVVPTNTPVPATATPTPLPTLTPTSTNTTTLPTSTPSTGGTLQLEYRTMRNVDPTTQIEPSFRITNYTSSAVPLSQLKIRYWFTRDTVRSLIYQCTYARLGCANITGAFVVLPTPRSGADVYVEVGFSTTLGNLAPNGTTNEVEVLVRKDNWSNFTQANDYSFDGTKSAYAPWTKVTLYQNGTLVWGTEP